MKEEKILPYFDSTVKVNGPYLDKKQNRYFVRCLYADGSKRVITYAKYLMENDLQRILNKDETVDHKDRNKLNDVLSNLQILDKSTHASVDNIRARPVEIACIRCGNKVFRSGRYIRGNAKKGKAGPFCGKSCAGKYGAELQNNREERLPVQPTVESEYYYLDK